MSIPFFSTMHDMFGDDSNFEDGPVYAVPDITTGLLLDYDADSLGAVATQVATWASSAGSLGAAANLTGGSTSKPVVVAGPNGHKAVRVDSGSSQYLRTAAFGSPVALPLTQVLVVRATSTGTASIISGNYSSSTSASSFAGIRRVSKGYDAGAGATGEIVNSSSEDTSGFHIVTVRHGLNALLRVDTVESPGVTGQAAPSLATLPRITLFANSAFNAQFFSGDVARLMMFGRALSNADIASLHATLGATYGIAAA